MDELQRRVVLPLPSVMGVDLSITHEVILLWTAAGVTLALLTLACRRRDPVPRGWFRNLFEGLIEFVDARVIRDSIGPAGAAWSPFLLSLFFFILFSNLLGLVPDPFHFRAATAPFSVPASLALLVFVSTVAVNIRRHGLLGFLRKFVPAGLSPWVAGIVVPIEIISWLVRPVSLAVRLFANMLVGHTLLFVLIALEMTAAWFLAPLPLAGAVAMECFELFVCIIQALVFTMLAGIYIRDAIEAH